MDIETLSQCLKTLACCQTCQGVHDSHLSIVRLHQQGISHQLLAVFIVQISPCAGNLLNQFLMLALLVEINELWACLSLVEASHQSYEDAFCLWVGLSQSPCCEVGELHAAFLTAIQCVTQFYFVVDAAMLIEKVRFVIVKFVVGTGYHHRIHRQTTLSYIFRFKCLVQNPRADVQFETA